MSFIKHSTKFYSIKDPRAARNVIDHIFRSPNKSLVLPYCDYPGPVIEETLERDFTALTVCEPRETIRSGLQDFLNAKYPHKRVQIYPDDLFQLSFKSHSDEAQLRCAEIVRENREISRATTSSIGESCDTNVKILIPLMKSKYETAFLRNIYYQICLKLGLCTNHLVHYYFLMSGRQHTHMEAKPGLNLSDYRSSSVLYNTIFNVKTLESYDLKKCFGIQVRHIQSTANKNDNSYNKVHLVWLDPKADIINSLSPRSLVEYRYLVVQMMHKRKGMVVEFLDRYFEGHNHGLQSLDINESTRRGDLSPDQYYKLFLFLKEQPNYRNSTFLNALAGSDEIILPSSTS